MRRHCRRSNRIVSALYRAAHRRGAALPFPDSEQAVPDSGYRVTLVLDGLAELVCLICLPFMVPRAMAASLRTGSPLART